MIKKQTHAKKSALIIMMNIFALYQHLSAGTEPQQPSSMQPYHMNLHEEDAPTDLHLTPPISCADFIRTSHDAAHEAITTQELLSMYSHSNSSDILDIDQNFENDLGPSRHFNNAYIKVNPDLNVDMRMTGSTTLLGKVTLPYTQKNFFTGTPMIIGTDGGIGIGNLNVPGDVTISGTLTTNSISFGDTVIFGDTHIFGQKTLDPIATLPSTTPALTLVFTNPAGTTGPLFKGANAHLQCFISGTVLGTPSIFLYDAVLFISPATTAGGTPPTVISITSATTTTIQGTVLPATITATTSGLGTTVVVSFGSLLGMTNQAVTLFYEITSDNLTSVA